MKTYGASAVALDTLESAIAGTIEDNIQTVSRLIARAVIEEILLREAGDDANELIGNMDLRGEILKKGVEKALDVPIAGN